MENEIRKWRVDVGLARPSVLTTKAAQDLQRLLSTEPDTSHCVDKKALKKWRELGPIRLSEIAMHSLVPLDLDDEHM